MAKNPRTLPNYLRTYRKRAGLTQRETAILLGISDPGAVSRHERGVRIPTLERALSYAAIYGVSVEKLCAGLAEEELFAARRRIKVFLVKHTGTSGREVLARGHLTSLLPPEEH